MAKKKPAAAVTASGLPADYPAFLDSLKSRVQQAQTKAMLSVNRELIELYWDIGRLIVERQEQAGWGQSVIDRISGDIQKAFPGIEGFSSSNISRMRAFFRAYRGDQEISAQAVPKLAGKKSAQSVLKSSSRKVAQAVRPLPESGPPPEVAGLPWGHNVVLLFKLKDPAQRLWYGAKSVEHGWSRAILTVQIESDLFGRHGKAISNFAGTLATPQSDLAQQALKDPYLFDFLTLQEDAVERDLELGLVDHIQKFLLELGAGFAFVGRQVPLSVGDEDDYLDLLFYHLKLRCFIVIDLKMRKFTPEDAGKMNYYLSAVDDRMKHSTDAPSVGLILCKSRDRIKAEYALRDITKPIGVAEWQTKLVKSLPEKLKGSLPTIEQLEAEFGPEGSS